LGKENPEDVRPIGMASVIRKVCGAILHAQMTDPNRIPTHSLTLPNSSSNLPPFNEVHFQNTQYGVSQHGTEKVIHSLRLHQTLHPDHDVFAMDGDNAFNRLNREVLIHEISEHHPYMLPFIKLCYGCITFAYFVGLASGVIAISSVTGVHQGDNLASWLYCLGIQPFVRQLEAILTNGVVKFYIDDGNIAGDTESMMRAIEFIQKKGPQFGYFLKVNKGSYMMGKCASMEEALNRKNQLISLGLSAEIIHFHPDNSGDSIQFGANILGAFLGSAQYVDAKLQKIGRT
jgi:hypothetical protein